jgi:8-oxo-dGTP pyrophosphatase MutT (NUDIX family)
MSYLVTEIPADEQVTWRVEVNGKKVNSPRLVHVSSDRFGVLSFGQRPEGTQGWSWREIGGGGSGIVLFHIDEEKKLRIGLLLEGRPNMGGDVWNIPRGFINPGDTHFDSACSELSEEVGIQNPDDRLFQLLGFPANANSTFFDTSEGGGFHFFGFEVKKDEVKKAGDASKTLIFKQGSLTPKSKMGERIYGCHFFPWNTVATMSDMFSNAGFARLLATRPDLVKNL